MNTNLNYSHIEYEIADISKIINKQQQYVKGLINQRINKAYQYDDYVKGQQLMLNRMMKQKNELENKLQCVHEKRYKEFSKSNAFAGVNDVMNIAFQYAHPKDNLTNKYVVEKRIRSARSHSPSRIINDNNDTDIVRVYKKDRVEVFLDFIIRNLKILKFICVIAFIIIKFVYILSYIYYKIYINLIV
jgi:hypothetical protein|uniref:Uncharacterized protein n=1 Tax=viral metagenome TaxID=1070528 RepID=A0A6C0LVN5_9ZZZZ